MTSQRRSICAVSPLLNCSDSSECSFEIELAERCNSAYLNRVSCQLLPMLCSDSRHRTSNERSGFTRAACSDMR